MLGIIYIFTMTEVFLPIQSNLSTTVSHGELQKGPLLTAGCCLGTYVQFS